MSDHADRSGTSEASGVPTRPSPGSSCWFGLLAAFVGAALVVGVAFAVRRGGDEAEPRTPVDAVLDAADASATPLAGELTDISVIYSADRGDAAVVGVEIPLPDGNDVYALWWADAEGDELGDAALVVTFRPDGEGVVEVAVEDFADIAADAGVDLDDAAYAVTIEATADVREPSGPVVARS